MAEVAEPKDTVSRRFDIDESLFVALKMRAARLRMTVPDALEHALSRELAPELDFAQRSDAETAKAG